MQAPRVTTPSCSAKPPAAVDPVQNAVAVKGEASTPHPYLAQQRLHASRNCRIHGVLTRQQQQPEERLGLCSRMPGKAHG